MYRQERDIPCQLVTHADGRYTYVHDDTSELFVFNPLENHLCSELCNSGTSGPHRN